MRLAPLPRRPRLLNRLVNTAPLSAAASNVALFVLRLVVGIAFIHHGWPKIQHPLTWSTGYLPLPAVLQLLSAIAEFIGAIALIFGLLTRLFAFLLLVDMIAAILLVKLPHGAVFVASAPRQASFERELLYCAVALVLLLVGPGRIALDALFAGRSIERGSFAG